MENIEIEKQVELFKKRVAFLKAWKTYLESIVSAHVDTEKGYEIEDKIHKLTIEIESKENLIAMRLEDIKQINMHKEKSDNEVKANYAMFIEKMKTAGEIKEPQARAIIDGIIKRSADSNLTMEEMTKDYKLMKSILSIIPKEQPNAPVGVKLEAVKSEK